MVCRRLDISIVFTRISNSMSITTKNKTETTKPVETTLVTKDAHAKLFVAARHTQYEVAFVEVDHVTAILFANVPSVAESPLGELST